MNKKKILKIVLFIILLLIILLAIHTIKNFIIIRSLQEKLETYSSSTNYHLKTVSTRDLNTNTTNYYTKNGKQVLIQERKTNGEYSKTSMYNRGNGEKIISYYDTSTEKVVKEIMSTNISVYITSYYESMADNINQTIFMSIILRIKNVEYNGKDCYIISPLFSKESDMEYIEKDTGLCVKSITVDGTVEKEYEFDNVNDEIFFEPDINQYKLVEEN